MIGEFFLLALYLMSGVVFGLVWTIIGFPIPAPPTLGGCLGVLGVFLGHLIATHIPGG